MNFLLQAGDVSMSPVWIILLFGLVIITVLGSIRNKKERTARNEMVEALKVGDEIVTFAGIYGKIISITNTTDGKIVLISTGDGDKVSYMQMHINAIASKDTKQPETEDEIPVFETVDNQSSVLEELEKEKKTHEKEKQKANKKK